MGKRRRQTEGRNLAANSQDAHATFSIITASSSSLLYSLIRWRAFGLKTLLAPWKPRNAPRLLARVNAMYKGQPISSCAVFNDV